MARQTQSDPISAVNLRTVAFFLFTATIFAAMLIVVPAAQAQTFNLLVAFNGLNGNGPNDLVLDSAGNLYGTTFYGGTYGDFGPGTVFKLTHHGSSWRLTTLYNFNGHSDGANPWAGVIFGLDGELYGTTSGDGLYDHGTVYKLQPPPTGCTTARCYWKETVLYNFRGGSDGGAPQGDLALDQAGNLYGTTFYGGQGSGSGNGVVYELSPSPGGWIESVIHAFTGGSDGGDPENGVVLDSAGNVYGSTYLGGANNLGVVYELSYGSSGWTETVLHDGGSDGPHPEGLVLDASGNIYGPTFGGGSQNDGTVFELQPASGGFNYSVIYTFQAPIGGPPPVAALSVDSAGNLYGPGSGGTGNVGIVFELSPSGGSWNLNVLFNFDTYDGYDPFGKLTIDPQGNLYGITEYGGPSDYGVVWELTP